MRLASLPRLPLAHLPTPLEPAPNLTAALGGPRILVKRDDLTGLALGGNKTRKLEYLIADAREQGASVVITVGSIGSNHCRQTAAAARVAGLRCVLVLNAASPDPPLQGNYLLDHLLGAEVRLIRDASEREPTMERVAEELRRQGERPYLIPGGGSNPVGASAYVAAVYEIARQLEEAGWAARHLYTTSSTSGGTHAGLVTGRMLTGGGPQVRGVGVADDIYPDVPGQIAALASGAASLLGSTAAPGPDDLWLDMEHLGDGYAVPTPEALAAIRLLAETEAILCDPVYSGKALAAVVADARAGALSGPTVFWHTGGWHAVFAPPFSGALLRAG
jgi:D-cysteine desulfhydrase family pyridoxal phosphate-dependent enzyme